MRARQSLCPPFSHESGHVRKSTSDLTQARRVIAAYVAERAEEHCLSALAPPRIVARGWLKPPDPSAVHSTRFSGGCFHVPSSASDLGQ